MRVALLTVAVVAVAVQVHPIAQSRDRVIGTWKLVSASAVTADGRVVIAPFGPSPSGVMTYTAEGRMTALISHGGRAALSGDRISSSASERAEAFATFFAYAGRYSIDGDNVIQHVEVSSVPNWVNTDMVRLVKFDGDRMTLRTPPLSVGGTIQTTELVWERVK